MAPGLALVHLVDPRRARRGRVVGGGPDDRAPAGARMTPADAARSGSRRRSLFGSRRALRLIERNLYVYRHGWIVIVSGFFEPLFYLLSIGFGLGRAHRDRAGPGRRSRSRTSSSSRRRSSRARR